EKVHGKFLFLQFTGAGFKDYLTPIFTGVSVPHLSPQQIRNFRVALPPLNEQIAIIDYLDSLTAEIQSTSCRADREIEVLNEYRTRLVADVVTGKFDVREAVDALPQIDQLDCNGEYGEFLDLEPDESLDEL